MGGWGAGKPLKCRPRLMVVEKAGVRQPKAAAQTEPQSRSKLHQGPHCGEASMRHQVDIFQ